jgi:hypothetical protein
MAHAGYGCDQLREPQQEGRLVLFRRRLRVSDLPIHAAQMRAQGPPIDRQSLWQKNLKCVTLDLAGDRTNKSQGLVVETIQRKVQLRWRRDPPVHAQPADRNSIQIKSPLSGHIRAYQTSTPRSGPQSIFSISAPSGNPLQNFFKRLSLPRLRGRLRLPHESDAAKSIRNPLDRLAGTGSAACATNSSGISTVRVFPTRMIWVVIGLTPAEIIPRIATGGIGPL